MKVIFAVPMYSGSISGATHRSLTMTRLVLSGLGIEHDELNREGNCYVSAARNQLVADFLKTDGTDLFFIDDDISFSPKDVMDILKRPEEVVGGIYRLKTEEEMYPVLIYTNRLGIPIVTPDGLIPASGLPTGFLRIKRSVFEKMCYQYPELKYEEKGNEYYGLFDCAIINGKWTGDDFAFCRRWSDIGGQMFVLPNLTLTHGGKKDYTGNYHKFLLNCPKPKEEQTNALLPKL